VSTSVAFTPSTTAAFTFQPVINGVQYNAVVTWNMVGKRYYLQLSDTSGNLLLCRSIVSSGPVLAATLTWEDDGVNGLATAATATVHNVPIGQLANIRVSQSGTGFDGSWQALSTGADMLTYALSNPDENQPVTGQLSFDVNLVATLNLGGILLFHYDSSSFEFE
jgi:hypothetical protein